MDSSHLAAASPEPPTPQGLAHADRFRGDRSISTHLERLPGVGTTRAQRLQPLGLVTVRDALIHFPREYKDFSGAHAFTDLSEGAHAAVSGVVTDIASRTTSRGQQMLTVLVKGTGGSVRGVWFNMPFMAKKMSVGMRVVFASVPKRVGHVWEMTHPEVRVCADGEEQGREEWLAVYPLADGVRQSDVRLAVRAAIDHAGDLVTEAFPAAMLAAKSLLPIADTFREIHFPTSVATMAASRRRFVYQELFMLQVALRMHHSQQETRHAAPALPINAKLDSRIRQRFGFHFTAAQRRVCGEIAADLARTQPMNRLLQGDVGSGKTAVAIYALLATVATKVASSVPNDTDVADTQAGEVGGMSYQAALMAPTELLARQHMATLERLLKGSHVNLELLVGGQATKRRQQAIDRIASGEAQIVVGTQALVCGSARFKNLGLVVIDEQHRFGVVQRGTLQQDQADPHTLLMTATPIPRTIAHAVYGDLDVSTLDEQPLGRQPVGTYRVAPDQLDAWWEFFRKKLREGRQGYVVVPAVEESKRGLESISSAFENLSNGPLEAFRLGLVHGRLSTKQKQSMMEAFRTGELDVLVATSVIEVGIDVPQATLMTILDADSFGLAQLHQLRGRVARGAVQGICAAVSASAEQSHPRIDAFIATTDGFKLAEQDLRLRGPGDLVGTRQSGAPPMYLADLLRDASVVAEARRDAIELYDRDPGLADESLQRLKELILDRWGETLGLGQVG